MLHSHSLSIDLVQFIIQLKWSQDKEIFIFAKQAKSFNNMSTGLVPFMKHLTKLRPTCRPLSGMATAKPLW